MPSLTVTHLFIHPVKSMRGLTQQAAPVGPTGLHGDRQWLVIDTEGRFITARDQERLLLWRPQPTAHGLTLTSPSGHTRDVQARDYTRPCIVTVWRDTFEAYQGPADTDAWLSAQLGIPCHLVYLGPEPQRPHAASAGVMSFADGAPFLLCSAASLAALNAQLDHPVAMRRFRPNIVIDGLRAYAEDDWTRLRIGDVVLQAYKPCTRCKMVNLDPDTAELSEQKEPLKTLAATHKLAQGACFGINLYTVTGGVVRVGDRVMVEAV